MPTRRSQLVRLAVRTSAILALGLSEGCSTKEVKGHPSADLATYRYKHLETTGITSEIRLADGTLQPILFPPESAQSELKSLEAVHHCHVFGTLDREQTEGGEDFEQRLFLVGELRPRALRTPDGPGQAMPENYREFVLHTWYLEAPFSAMVWPSSNGLVYDLDAPFHVQQYSSISAACSALAAPKSLDGFVHDRR